MSFELKRFRDIDVWMNLDDPDHSINLTKLAKSLTGSDDSFKHAVAHNESMWKLISSYLSAEQLAILNGANEPIKKHSIGLLVEIGVCISITGRPTDRSGAYGPSWLADWLVINFKPEYFKQIHQLFETIEKSAELNNRNFEEELKALTEERDSLLIDLEQAQNDIRTLLDLNSDVERILGLNSDSKLELKKYDILSNYDSNKLYISVGGFRRKIYIQQNGDWNIRLGKGGSVIRSLTENEILNGYFTKNPDPRIRYE